MNIILELRTKISTLTKEIRALMDDKKVEEAKVKMEEVRSLKAALEIEEALIEEERADLEKQGKRQKTDTKSEDDEHVEYRDVFVKYIRNMALKPEERKTYTETELRALSSNKDEDGKLLIPQDISTKIIELKREYQDMYNYVNVEPVGTLSGKRPVEQDATHTPLEGVGELVSIPNIGNPKFVPLEYNCKDFKGLIEIPNSFLKDEDADILGYLAKWIAKKQVATHNALIFYADGTKGTEGILGVKTGGFDIETVTKPLTGKEIKKVLNVKLPSAIAKEAILFTNQDGFNYLDNLQDKNGRDLLEDLGNNKYKLDKKTLTIITFDNKTLLNDDKKNTPFIFGNAKEGITYFDRETMSMASSSEAGFDNDATKTRVIIRGDVKQVDKKALHVIYAPTEVTETKSE